MAPKWMTKNKIKKQVEFYFSDANIRVDTFLKQQALLNNGYVPIETILTFKKMKELEATVDLVKECLKDSKVVEIKDDTIKKIETEEFKNYIADKNIDEKCLYISGFDPESNLEDIENILKDHIDFLLVRMRRTKDKKFSGSVFVELKSKEDVERALGFEIMINKDDESAKRNKEEVKYLKIMRKTDFLKEKEKISEEKKNQEARESLVNDFMDKLYKYAIEGDDCEIHEIKKIVKDVAFVDKNKKVIRMKYKKEHDTKTYEEEKKKISLTKMNPDEVKIYCEDISVKPKLSLRGKKNKKDKSKVKKNYEKN